MNLNDYNKKIENNKLKIQRLKREDLISKARARSSYSKEKRKKRNHDLIMRGALFETVGLIGEAPEALLGFLMENIGLYHANKDEYFKIGFKELKLRKNRDGGLTRMISNNEINQLLEISLNLKAKDIDVGHVMQDKFKKKLFEELTYEEFIFFRELDNLK